MAQSEEAPCTCQECPEAEGVALGRSKLAVCPAGLETDVDPYVLGDLGQVTLQRPCGVVVQSRMTGPQAAFVVCWLRGLGQLADFSVPFFPSPRTAAPVWGALGRG